MLKLGLLVRSTLIGVIYRKTLKLSNKVKDKIDEGEILNNVSTDTTKIQNVFHSLHYLRSGPLQIIIIHMLLLRCVGVYSLLDFAIIIIIIPNQGLIMALCTSIKKK